MTGNSAPSSSTAQDEQPPLWEYIALTDYQAPQASLEQSVRKRLDFLRDWYQREIKRESTETTDSPFIADDSLQQLPDWQLEHVAPQPLWEAAIPPLNELMAQWLNGSEQTDHNVVLFVGPPHADYANILQKWAQQENWLIIDPPETQTILSGGETWLERITESERPWFLPALEHTYLRHVDGLDLVRAFLDKAFTGHLGKGVIACNSWAWAFLKHAWQGRSPVPRVIQAFDRDKLSQHLQNLEDQEKPRNFIFRQADDGSYIIPLPEEISKKLPEDAIDSEFMQHLAAYSRGIPGVARAIWRDNLRTEPDEALNAADEAEAAIEGHEDYERTIWVAPWDAIQHPKLPDDTDRNNVFILHSLLLQGGLSTEALGLILMSVPPNQITETLLLLERAAIINYEQGRWQVTPQAYPVVRSFLAGHNMLLDDF